MTLTGTAAVANYQLALNTVQYRNSRMNPTAGFRAITFSVSHGQVASAEAETYINVDVIIQAPTIRLDTVPFTFVEGTSSPIAIATSFTVTDQDAPLPDDSGLYVDGATVSITNDVPGEDLLTFTPTSSIIGMFNSAQGILQLSGRATFAEYQAVLRSVKYEHVSEAPSTATRTIKISLIAGATEMLAPSVQVNVVSLSNPPTMTSGVIEEVHLLQNSAAVSMGLDDLVFAPPSAKEPTLWAIPVNLPSDVVGQITLADGSTVELGKQYTIDELRGKGVLLNQVRRHGPADGTDATHRYWRTKLEPGDSPGLDYLTARVPHSRLGQGISEMWSSAGSQTVPVHSLFKTLLSRMCY